MDGSIDVLRATPPLQPLSHSLDFMVKGTPRRWLRLRKLVRNLYTDILSSVSEIVREALSCIEILMLGVWEQSTSSELMNSHKPYILARRLVLISVQQAIYAFAPALQWQEHGGLVTQTSTRLKCDLHATYSGVTLSEIDIRNSDNSAEAMYGTFLYLYEQFAHKIASGPHGLLIKGKFQYSSNHRE